jgi:hypothetical protein
MGAHGDPPGVVAIVDLASLRYFMRKRGVSAHKLSVNAGCDGAYVGRLLRDRSTATAREATLWRIVAVARELRVPLEAIVPSIASPALGMLGHMATWTQSAPIMAFLDELRGARHVLTLHHGLDTYLLHPDMAKENAAKATVPAHYSGQQAAALLQWGEQYWRRAQSVRHASGYFHRIVAPERFFHEITRADWVDASADLLHDLAKGDDRIVALALLPDSQFEDMKREVSMLLPTGDWSRVTIIDQNVAMVRVGLQYHTTYHRPTVVEMLRRVEDAVVKYIAHWFPASDKRGVLDLSHSTVDACNKVTLAKLKAIAKELSVPTNTNR